MLRGAIFWLVMIAGLPLSFVRPFAGILLYLALAHSRLADFVWPGYGIQNWGLLTAAATLFGYFAFGLRKSPPHLSGLKILIALWLWLTIASVLAFDPTVALPKLYQYSCVFVMTVLIAAMADSEERIRMAIMAIGGSVGFLGAKGALDFFLTGGQFRMQGPGGLMADENEYALGLNMAIPILIWLSTTEERRWLRWILRMMAVSCGVLVIGTHSRSGFLGLLAAGLLLVLYSRRKLVGILGLAAASLVFLFIVPDAAMERYKGISTANQTDASAIARLNVWQVGFAMVRAHPIAGVGLRNFEPAVPRFSALPPRAPHNAFLALSAEAGLPACGFFVALILGAAWRMFRLQRKLLEFPENFRLAAYCRIVGVALLVYLVPNFFINRQDFDLMYHLVGISAALTMVARRKLVHQYEELSQAEVGLAEPVGTQT